MSTPQTPATRAAAPAVAKKTVKDWIQSDAFRDQIAKALPKHLTPDRFLRVALTSTLKTPALLECTPESVTSCLLQCSALGLEPDGRRAHLIPFRDNRKGVTTCTLIIDYKGLAELAMRSGLVSNIHADVVRENDVFEYDMGEIKAHKIDFRNDRGPAYAFYAICRFKDGSIKADVMSVDEVEAIRKRSKSPDSGPWVTDPVEMGKKTVFRRLSKWLPLSPEFRDAVESEDEVETMRNVTPMPDRLPAPLFQAPTVEPEVATPQSDLALAITSQGLTVDNFNKWAMAEKLITAEIAEFSDLSDELATKLLKAREATVDGIRNEIGGGK